MNIDKEVNQLKKKLTALYKKYRGQVFSWYKSQQKRLKKEWNNFNRRIRLLIVKSLKELGLREERNDVEDKLNRKVYTRKIADVIDSRHGQKNVIFAISGKWGSGKTRVLKLLRPLLRGKGFKVIWFQPWHYSQEPISLKRAFLKALAENLKSNVDLSDLYQESTQIKVSVGRVLRLFILLAFLLGIYNLITFPVKQIGPTGFYELSIVYLIHFKETLDLLFSSNIFQILLIPVALFLIKDVFAFKRTTSQITTSEQFKEKFNDILKKHRKVVVFIDDLDRCAAEVVKEILDALTTFFGHRHCSFVVTGDHTVIEKYIGSKLYVDPEYTEENKIDEKLTRRKEVLEGRRFLKKLFDVYWLIPSPEPVRFRAFIASEIKKAHISNLGREGKKQLVNLLDKFLERNPRAVARFLTALSFNLDTINYMIGDIDLNERNATEVVKQQRTIELQTLKEVLKNPVLLAKVLMIQELFYPLYEELILHPDIVPIHEKDARKTGKPSPIEGKTVSELLSGAEQRQYLELLKLPPKFTHDETDAVVFNADNFLYLSGFTGLPSQKGPDEDKFLQLLKTTTDSKVLIKDLQGASEKKQKQLLSLAEKALANPADANEKQNISINMADIMLELHSWSSGFDGLVTKLQEENFIHSLQAKVRSRIASSIFHFSFSENVNVASFFTTPPWNDAIYLPDKWTAVTQIGHTLHKDVISQLTTLVSNEFEADASQALAHLENLVAKSNQEDKEILNHLTPLYDKLVDVAFSKPAGDDRMPFLKALSTLDHKKVAKQKLIKKLSAVLGSGQFQAEIKFFLENQQVFHNYLEDEELKSLREGCIDALEDRDTTDWHPLADTLIANPPWDKYGREKIGNAVINHLKSDIPNMFPYSLTYIQKKEFREFMGELELFNQLVASIDAVSEENKTVLLEHLSKSNWESSKISRSDASILRGVAGSKNKELAKKAKELLAGWSIKFTQRKRKKREAIKKRHTKK
ncbi:hypothetical protein IH980_02485 [Patescibacteria group bacterium]|nr:hypothetical protein [Patescibacteria group bacterium]